MNLLNSFITIVKTKLEIKLFSNRSATHIQMNAIEGEKTEHIFVKHNQ